MKVDGLAYPVELDLSIVERVDVDDAGNENESEMGWAADALHLPRHLDGDVTVQLDGGEPIAAKAIARRLTGSGVPDLPPS